jgi:hypothetical protein
MSGPLAVWTGALLTLAVLSYLYADNPAWRVTEHLYVGLAAGYGLGYTWQNYLRPVLQTQLPAPGGWIWLLPLALGALLYARYVPRLEWLSRFPLGVWIGYGAGYILAYLPRVVVGQVTGSMVDLSSLTHLALMVCLLGAFATFVFTLPDRSGPLRAAGRVGRYAILVALGVAFGGAVLYRFTLLYGRIQFLVHGWLGLGR